ncbi:MAG: hypothetical protein ACLQBA_12075 [Candidatus Binataceae bacterium]
MSDRHRTFVIPRTTGTHGDIFAAVGLADLLSGASDSPVSIRENPAGFEIDATLVGPIPQKPGYPFLKPNEKMNVPSGIMDFVDYKAEKAKSDRRKKLTQGKSKKSLGPEIEELLRQDAPRPDWRLLQVLNSLGAWKTSNRVFADIVKITPAEFSQAVSAALDSIASFAPSGLAWLASSVQLFSPNSAKGYSRLKPDSTGRNDKTKEDWTDPFIEWLRYRGYFAVACPFFDGSKAENVRLLCPVPANVSVNALREICDELRQAGVFGRSPKAPKLDSLATLKLAEILIRRSEEFHDADAAAIIGISILGGSPAKIISGIAVTHYQSLGNSKAVSSMSTLALPGWFVLNDAADALAFLSILDEHQRVVRSLQDDHSDEIGLLILYRRFLELRGEHSILTLIDFMSRYGALVLRAREQKRWIAQFSTENFERLLMQNAAKLAPLLNDPGFQAVAAAIRNATINAQLAKAFAQRDKRPAQYRDIRYDLLAELRRKSSLPGDVSLIQALSEFVQLYNYENARQHEILAGGKSSWRPPRNITTDEFSSLVALIETHHAATVGPMLCAYGTCRIPKDPELAGVNESETTASEQD